MPAGMSGVMLNAPSLTPRDRELVRREIQESTPKNQIRPPPLLKLRSRYIVLEFRTNINRPISFSLQRHQTKASLGPGSRSIESGNRCIPRRLSVDKT